MYVPSQTPGPRLSLLASIAQRRADLIPCKARRSDPEIDYWMGKANAARLLIDTPMHGPPPRASDSESMWQGRDTSLKLLGVRHESSVKERQPESNLDVRLNILNQSNM